MQRGDRKRGWKNLRAFGSVFSAGTTPLRGGQGKCFKPLLSNACFQETLCPKLAELFPVTAIFIHNACVTERLFSTMSMMRHLCNESHTPPKQEKRRRIKATPLIGGWGVENPKPVKGISLGGLGWAYKHKDGASPLRHMTQGEAAVVLLKTRNPKPETRNRLESDFWVALRIGTRLRIFPTISRTTPKYHVKDKEYYVCVYNLGPYIPTKSPR